MEIVSENKAHGGRQLVCKHASIATGTDMVFSIYLPPQVESGVKLPVVWYLSGLTCTHANVTEKGEYRAACAELGLIFIAPDTSPRGEAIADDPEYDMGQGAGFYVDATQEPFATHYRMWTYVTEEVPALVASEFPADAARQGITGHSMGGHGALTVALRHPERFRSVSAFAPIVAPSQVPWGQKALGGYLGEDRADWRRHDAVDLIEDGARVPELLIDVGEADPFIENELRPELLEAACRHAGIDLTLRRQPGYDHSYYFISTFMADHLRWHAERLRKDRPMTLSRRDFIRSAAAMGAALAWAGPARASRTNWQEQRNLYPEGVASGDPDPASVILWTRRPYDQGDRHLLTVEVATDPAFRRVVAQAPAPVSAASDWTARVLVGRLKPATTYWYRFTDSAGNGSRIGRTITAPRPNDPRPVNFAFVSCQTVNEGTLNGYRRMIFEDERAVPAERIGFILHLGDFIYEVVQYPEEVKTRYDRTIYEVARIPDALKVSNFYLPTTIDGYRAIYRGYLHDPDLQDARARWPFVCMWDNHEFSWQGWQSVLKAGPIERPGQSVKVAANQAWFEYIPARVTAPSGSLEKFDPPAVKDVPIERWDDNGLGDEPNNLIAIRSLTAYRALRYGRHLDLILTDQYSYRSADPTDPPGVEKIFDPSFNGMFSLTAMIALDGGREAGGGNPPAELSFRDARIPNPRKDAPPRTILGAGQKAWFKERLRKSTATWKIWGNSLGAIDHRIDPGNLPADMPKTPWPRDELAMIGSNDYGSAYHERGEIYDLIREARITGFGIVSGDRHSFWAGYASAQLPPGRFEPVGVSFVVGSMSSPGAMEAYENGFKKDRTLRPLYLADRPDGKIEWVYNMLLRHGVRSALEYGKSFDRERAQALSNPALAPHLEFVDMGGHGYAKVRLSGEEMRTEFVCIPRPIVRSERPDGGPLRYRVAHTARLWRPGERPQLVQQILEGDAGLGS